MFLYLKSKKYTRFCAELYQAIARRRVFFYSSTVSPLFSERRSRVAPLCCRCCCWCSDTWTLWPSSLWGRITKVSFFWVGPKKKEHNYLGFSIGVCSPQKTTHRSSKVLPKKQKKKRKTRKRPVNSSFLKQHHPPKAPLG